MREWQVNKPYEVGRRGLTDKLVDLRSRRQGTGDWIPVKNKYVKKAIWRRHGDPICHWNSWRSDKEEATWPCRKAWFQDWRWLSAARCALKWIYVTGGMEWTGPLECLSLFAGMSVDKDTFFTSLLSFTDHQKKYDIWVKKFSLEVVVVVVKMNRCFVIVKV